MVNFVVCRLDDLRVHLCKAAFQPVDPQTIVVYGIISPQVQDFPSPYVELEVILIDRFLWPAKVPLNGSMMISSVKDSSQFIICKLAWGAFFAVIQAINEDVR